MLQVARLFAVGSRGEISDRKRARELAIVAGASKKWPLRALNRRHHPLKADQVFFLVLTWWGSPHEPEVKA